MRIYFGSEPRMVKLGIRYPGIEKVRKIKIEGIYPSVESGVLSIRKGRISVAPVYFKDLIASERIGKPIPALVVVGICRYRGKILLGIRSNKVREPNRIGAVPAGHVEFVESPEEAIKKELWEEIKAEGKPHFSFLTFDSRFLAFFYEIELENDKIVPNWEWKKVFWVKESKLKEFLIDKVDNEVSASSIIGYLAKREGEKVVEEISKKKGMMFEIKRIEEIKWSAIKDLRGTL